MTGSLSEAEEYRLFGNPDTEIQDCDFLQAVFRAEPSPVSRLLDLACGTGRHALKMARRGYRVTGVDASADMLAAAGQAAREAGLALDLGQKDIRSLDLPPEFDAAYILFNTIILLVANDDLLSFLRGVHAALKPGGLLVIEVGTLWPLIATGKLSDSVYDGEEQSAGVRRVRHMESRIGPYSNVMWRRNERRFWRDGQELAPKVEELPTRIYSLSELDLACRLTGFSIRQVFGAMDATTEVEDPLGPAGAKATYGSYVLVLQK